MERLDGGRRTAGFALRRFHHSGIRPIKVLLIGDSADLLASDADSTLAERMADRMWLQTRHGVDVDVLTDLAPVLRAVQGAFETWRLWRYDVVVVVLAVGALSTHHPRTLARVGDLLGEVIDDAAGATDVVVLGKGEGTRSDRGTPSDSAGHRLREAIEAFGSERVRFRPVAADTESDPDARDRSWAVAAAEEVAASMTALGETVGPETAAMLRGLPDEEAARQRALDALDVVGRGADPRLDDLVELARAAFGTECAEINFIDHDQQWKMAVAGSERAPNPRAHSFCTLTIQQAEPTVVSDTRLDPRFSPLVTGSNPVRFYAAHPIESPDGYRIGSLCVYDPEPRDVDGLDLAVLRDLALLAQAEISGADSAPGGMHERLATW